DANAGPRPRLLGKVHLFTLADAGDLRHLAFQLLVPLAKLGDLPQAVLDTSNEVIPLGLCRPKCVFLLLPDLGSPLRQFGFKARPCALVLAVVLALEQA